MVVRRKVDDKVGALIANSIEDKERCFIIIVGTRTKDQVLNLYNIRHKLAGGGARPTVCWCYKKTLEFTANKMKKLAQIKRKKKMKTYDDEVEDPFWLFQQGTKVTYCRYKDSQRLLGNTFDVLVLQDFEALTPNIMCRAVETVKGGGMILLLFKELDTFRDLYHQRLDLFSKKYEDAVQEIKPRYCERFVKSLTQCRNCLILNDRLEILPISQARLDEITIRKGNMTKADRLGHEEETLIDPGLLALRSEFEDNKWIGPILKQCVTFDQAKIVALIATKMSNMTASDMIAVLASRGRGKSAALGLGLAISVPTRRWQRVGVCATTIENVSTIFEFLGRGFDALGIPSSLIGEAGYMKLTYGDVMRDKLLREKLDELENSTKKSRLSLTAQIKYKSSGDESYETTITYVDLKEIIRLPPDQFDVLLIDEAASIPIPLLQKTVTLNAPILIASTVDGYEGTGLGLTQVVLHKLEKERQLVRQTMTTPIRYASNDPIEKWLRHLLCLNAGAKIA